MPKNVKYIDELALKPGHNIMMAFREGFVFGRVVYVDRDFFKPYALIDGNGNAVDIDANSSQTGLLFRDPRSTDNILAYMDTNTAPVTRMPWIMHGCIGIRPHIDALRLYIKYPEGQGIGGQFPDSDPTTASAGNYTGYISGVLSPYENPTEYGEFWIPPNTKIAMDWYNDDTRNHRPVLNLQFREYHLKLLSPNGPSRERELIGKIANGVVPHRIAQFGSPRVGLINYKLESDWKVPVISLEEAESYWGGR